MFHLQHGWLPPGVVADDVLVEVADGRLAAVTEGQPVPPGATQLPGLTLPGLANVHSHAFHRALRGRTQHGAGDFWTWREQMYAVAATLDPDSYHQLARDVYAEMVGAGITCVGEFHYLHHTPGGTPYDDPNAMGEALIAAAADAGLRITLLDTCYLAGGIGVDPDETQRRFSDGDAPSWAHRVDQLETATHARIGAAIHSVRAVPADQLRAVADWASSNDAVLHLHLSEQPGENEACLAAHGRTPTALLAEHGVLGSRTVAVHATHLTDVDIALLGDSRTGVCACPTTERDLADGVGPFRALLDAGSPLSLGSDSHAVIDLFEEARAVELDARLVTGRRGHFSTGELLSAATETGHAALGWPEAGRIEVGAIADLVTVDLTTPRTRGIDPAQVVFAATGADVRHVVNAGRVVRPS